MMSYRSDLGCDFLVDIHENNDLLVILEVSACVRIVSVCGSQNLVFLVSADAMQKLDPTVLFSDINSTTG
jgi:hypothetical protein